LFIVKDISGYARRNKKMESVVGRYKLYNHLDFDIIESGELKYCLLNPIYDLGGKTILVVEDNAMNQMVIKMITKKWLNTTVLYANNGQED
jgi:hypothetical protein